MPGGGSRNLGDRERVRTAGEYQRIFRQGRRLDGPLFLLVAAPNGRARARLGIAAGRRVGSAVARNRAKRLLRESFRLAKAAAPPGIDMVLVAKPEIHGCSQREVEREFRERLRRLAARGGVRNRRTGAPAGA